MLLYLSIYIDVVYSVYIYIVFFKYCCYYFYYSYYYMLYTYYIYISPCQATLHLIFGALFERTVYAKSTS